VAVIARFLIDTSAAARMRLPAVVDRLYSARSPQEYEQVRADRREAYEYLPTDDDHWQRAFEAQRRLARTGRHRAVGIADLLTAVLAAQHRITIVHYDADFEIAAEVLTFEHRWVLPRGSV
jgi:predicted nucleic acid-binding protein